MGFLILASLFQSCQENEYKKGTVYMVQMNKGYTTWRIDSINKKHIWYTENDLHVIDSLNIKFINKPKFYTDISKKMTKKEFKTITYKYPIE